MVERTSSSEGQAEYPLTSLLFDEFEAFGAKFERVKEEEMDDPYAWSRIAQIGIEEEVELVGARNARIKWFPKPSYSRLEHRLSSGSIRVIDPTLRSEGIGAILYSFGKKLIGATNKPEIIKEVFDEQTVNQKEEKILAEGDIRELWEVATVLREVKIAFEEGRYEA